MPNESDKEAGFASEGMQQGRENVKKFLAKRNLFVCLLRLIPLVNVLDPKESDHCDDKDENSNHKKAISDVD
jgi:hypothetical protein